VLGLMPKIVANFDWDKPSLCRSRRISVFGLMAETRAGLFDALQQLLKRFVFHGIN
jgi:hypothetical protein